jgi:hypothetical protein
MTLRRMATLISCATLMANGADANQFALRRAVK